MDIRCRGCNAEVSEWAALCPVCRRPLDDAELLPEPERAVRPEPVAVAPSPPPSPRADEEDDEPTDPPRPALPVRRRTSLLVVAAVAVVGLVAGVVSSTGVLSSAGAAHRRLSSGVSATQPNEGTPPAPAALPGELAAERLFFAEPGRTGLYQSDGVQLSDIRVSGAGFPLQPLVSGLGVAVFIHGDDAYRTSLGAAAPAIKLGPARWIFPGRNGTIGIQSGTATGPSTVQYMAADGDFPATEKKTFLPAGEMVIAQVPLGLVVIKGADLAAPISQVDQLRVSLVMEADESASQMQATGFQHLAPELLGSATDVIGVYGSTVAWVRCPADGSVNCSLYLVNTTNLYTRVIPKPATSIGFAQGGSASPNGRLLATFVRTGTSGTNPLIRLEVYNLTTGALTAVGAPLSAAAPQGTATWSTDGHYLYFGSLQGPLYAEPTSAIGTSAQAVTLPLTTSFAVAGY
jgi:hypothetical protein